MKITHTVGLKGEEVDLVVSVHVSAWDRDDYGRAVIEDLAYDYILFPNAEGVFTIATEAQRDFFVGLLEADENFLPKIYAALAEAMEEIQVDRQISIKEDRRDDLYDIFQGLITIKKLEELCERQRMI